jgi:hypothetical protein
MVKDSKSMILVKTIFLYYYKRNGGFEVLKK